MREIKFRGKRLDNGEWVYGSILVIEDTYFIIEPIDFSYDNDADATAFWFDCTEQEVDPATVGQYTGLKDKNGKEIYEGDIIRCFCPETLFIDYMGIIKFEDCSFNFYHIDGDGMLRMRDFDGLAIEIMGNIHNNPELMK